MASKVLSYEELMEYAKKYYNKGGDSIYECWGRSEYDYYVSNFGPMTKEAAREMFRVNYSREKEIRSTAW